MILISDKYLVINFPCKEGLKGFVTIKVNVLDIPRAFQESPRFTPNSFGKLS